MVLPARVAEDRARRLGARRRRAGGAEGRRPAATGGRADGAGPRAGRPGPVSGPLEIASSRMGHLWDDRQSHARLEVDDDLAVHVPAGLELDRGADLLDWEA